MGSPRGLVRALALLAAAAALAPLGGCGKKEEPSAPGYYTGPMTPKGQAGGPAGAGKGQPARRAD